MALLRHKLCQCNINTDKSVHDCFYFNRNLFKNDFLKYFKK